MQCGEHDNFILKALPEMSKGIGVQHEGGYGEKKKTAEGGWGDCVDSSPTL